MIRLTGMNSGLDTDAMVKELVSAYEKKGQKTKNAKTKHEWKTDIWSDVNKKIKAFNSKVKSMQFSSSYSAKKTTSSDENKVSVLAKENAVRGTQTITVEKLAKTAYVTGKELKALDSEGKETGEKVTGKTKLSALGVKSTDGVFKGTVSGKSIEFDVDKDTTIDEFVSMLKATGVNASFDAGNSRVYISAKESGEKGKFEFENDEVIKALGLTDETGGKEIAAENAVIYLNDVRYESSSNSFDINGLAINVKGTTDPGNKITLTTETDADAIYNNIKSVINEYSKLINELSKLYNADSARKFEPLTDDEKDAMTDDEVEKWETKIKDSLLRRDGNLSSVINAMKNVSMETFIVGGTRNAEGKLVGGKKMTLSDFGIGTLGYFSSGENEKSALHISGDSDDESVSGETNKLKAMIATDPDSVADFFTQYMSKLSDEFNTLSRSTTNRSYGNFYDDKKIKADMTTYEKKVSDFEVYLADIEDKYYKQFTQMEVNMAKLNNTQSQLSNYFG